MPSKIRLKRIADQIREELAEMLVKEIGDPRLSGIIVTDVNVDRELAYAEIFVSAVEGQERQRGAGRFESRLGFPALAWQRRSTCAFSRACAFIGTPRQSAPTISSASLPHCARKGQPNRQNLTRSRRTRPRMNDAQREELHETPVSQGLHLLRSASRPNCTARSASWSFAHPPGRRCRWVGVGLGAGLRDAGKQVQMVLADGVPPGLRHLAGSRMVKHRAQGNFDLAVVLDCSDLPRTGGVAGEAHPRI